MPVQDPKRVYDGYLTSEGGVDSGKQPVLLAQNQLAWMVNGTVRGGSPTTRPPFKKKTLDFTTFALTQAQITAFKTGLFQGSGSYQADNGYTYQVVSISGRIFAINLTLKNQVQEILAYSGVVTTANVFIAPAFGDSVDVLMSSTVELSIGTTYAIDAASYTLTAISGNTATWLNVNDPIGSVNPGSSPVLLNGNQIPQGDRSNSTLPHAWFCQAENWLIIQNGADPALLWDGLNITRSNPAMNQVPTGGPMAYGRGRLWVARGSLYFGGDLVWGNPALGRNSVIYFTENTFLLEGGAFAVPGGPITGLSFAANLDTSLGNGDLLVFTPDSVFAFEAPIDRTTWANLNYPIQRYALLDHGGLNQESLCRINGDIFFRSSDGVRSLVYARREFNTWANTPIGNEVGRVLDYDSENLLYAASAVNFNNRYHLTCSPRNAQGHGVYHSGLVVIDFNLISGLNGNVSPCWEGVWTGLKILQITSTRVNGISECNIFHLNDSNEIELYSLETSGDFDFDGTNDVRIESVIETRGLVGNSANGPLPGSLKRFMSTDLWFTRIAGTLDVDGYFRNERSEEWIPIGANSACANYEDCAAATPPDCLEVKSYRNQGRSRMGLPTPQDVSDTANGGLYRDGYVFQIRLELTGCWRLQRFRAGFTVLTEEQFGDLSNATCDPATQAACQGGTCTDSVFCDSDDFSYSI